MIAESFRIFKVYVNDASPSKVVTLKQNCIAIIKLICTQKEIPFTLKNLTSPDEVFTLITGLGKDMFPEFLRLFKQ